MSVTFPEISSESQKQIIETGFEFMQALITAYGDSRATEIWDSFTVAIDPDIRHEMLIAMLKGRGNLGKTISLDEINTASSAGAGYNSGLIETIKALRWVSGMGLKEAKDTAEAVRDHGPVRVELKSSISRAEAMRCLRDAGCKAS